MRIAVLGATGRTGGHVVTQGLARGHHITAVARRPEAVTARHENLARAGADVLDRDQVLEALTGSEAVVSALGVGASRAATVIYSQGTANTLSVMHARGIEKLAVISAAPVGPRAAQPWLQRRVAMPILERLFGASYEDMRRMEALLRASDVDWVSLRPPRLLDRAARGEYRLDIARPPAGGRALTCADLATALLDSLGRQELHRRAAYVAN